MSGGNVPPFGPLGVMRSWLRLNRAPATPGRGYGAWWAWLVMVLGVLYFFVEWLDKH